MFEISRYLSQELCDVGLNISPHIVSVTLFSASSAKNASFFLVMNIHLLGEKAAQSAILRANYNLCMFCRFMQNYKVYAYVISMEFSVVNRRRPSRETPFGRERRRTAVFAGYASSLGWLVGNKYLAYGSCARSTSGSQSLMYANQPSIMGRFREGTLNYMHPKLLKLQQSLTTG